ncbi:MAG: TonB family protein [Candidatus Eremiobacteraeota bacterium]|nr:TonB family protein [Candidatus Eremiobacteraeota bacterium]
MAKARTQKSPTRRERRTIALVTAAFILVSAVLHMVLGGLIRPTEWSAAPTPSITELSLVTLKTPPPTPPPTPRSSPTPVRNQTRPSTAPQVPHAHPSARPRRPIVLVPTTQVTEQPGTARDDSGSVPATPSPLPPAPVDARYVIVSARFNHQVQPTYPAQAVSSGEEGTVIVLLTIGPSGVSDMRVWESSGYPDLDQAALRAAKESTYFLPEVNGQPATETYRIIYTFSLNT